MLIMTYLFKYNKKITDGGVYILDSVVNMYSA